VLTWDQRISDDGLSLIVVTRHMYIPNVIELSTISWGSVLWYTFADTCQNM